MARISELMQGKKPGEIKIRCDSRAGYFQPYFVTKNGVYVGLDECGDICSYSYRPGEVDNSWQLYTEPKPKVIYYEFLSIPIDEGIKSTFARVEYYKEGTQPFPSIHFDYVKTGRTVEVEGE